MINKIGIENFRIFKEYNEFELAPFTILTGPNNSGKSSFIKFLLLLKEGIENLNFEQGKLHNLENFEKVLNWETRSKELRFSFNFGNNYVAQFTYNKTGLKYISLFRDKTHLFSFYEKDTRGTNEISIFEHFFLIKNLNIDYLIDIIYNIDITSHSIKEVTEILYGRDEINNFFELDINLLEIFRNLNRDGLLYEVYWDGVNITDRYKNDLLKAQKTFFEIIEFGYFPFEEVDFTRMSLFEKTKYIIESIKGVDHFKRYLKNKKPFDIEEDLEIRYSPLGDLIFKHKISLGNIEPSGEEVFFNIFSTYFSFPVLEMNLDLKPLQYISANRGSQKRILSNKSENDIDEIVLEFTKSKNIREDFINKAFQILGIEGELKVERHENVISVVKIKNGENEISLADLGFGFSQVIPIILKISNMTSKYEHLNKLLGKGSSKDLLKLFGYTLILEEPEANLHPNLQSKLADILALAYNEFGIHFIIETHSEYLIRKLQYLTAKKEIKTDDSVIYYFNADKYVTLKEKKIKEIRINETGGLTDTFGPGFFDESTRLQFELLKINQDQIN